MAPTKSRPEKGKATKREERAAALKGAQPHNGFKGTVKGQNFYHDAATVKRLNVRAPRPTDAPCRLLPSRSNPPLFRSLLDRTQMYKGGKPVRDRNGKIVKAAEFQSSVAGKARVQPDRRWFGNTRVIGQAELDRFREEMSKQVNDPYQVVLRQSKLPMSLLTEAAKASPRMDLLGAEPFSATFGGKAVRKRPKLAATSVEELLSTVSKAEGAQPRARKARAAWNHHADTAARPPLGTVAL